MQVDIIKNNMAGKRMMLPVLARNLYGRPSSQHNKSQYSELHNRSKMNKTMNDEYDYSMDKASP